VRLGFKVSARTVAKYMRRPYAGKPSSGWRKFLKRHARDILACDFFCVQAIWFQTFYVFFAIRHVNREVLHVQVNPPSHDGMGDATDRRMLRLGS
jgi:putative transposase